ncbi:hypothetical protein HYW21_03350 [Candidatus Woesearchaeota archaeon]|nr:hypothetical protein [Candidatus Woesearchaeota archaeon]
MNTRGIAAKELAVILFVVAALVMVVFPLTTKLYASLTRGSAIESCRSGLLADRYAPTGIKGFPEQCMTYQKIFSYKEVLEDNGDDEQLDQTVIFNEFANSARLTWYQAIEGIAHSTEKSLFGKDVACFIGGEIDFERKVQVDFAQEKVCGLFDTLSNEKMQSWKAGNFDGTNKTYFAYLYGSQTTLDAYRSDVEDRFGKDTALVPGNDCISPSQKYYVVYYGTSISLTWFAQVGTAAMVVFVDAEHLGDLGCQLVHHNPQK